MSSLSSVIHYGFTASAGLSGNAKLLRITDIQDGKVQWDDVPFCEIDKKGLCNYQLENDDIVIARTGGTVGKSFVISNISVVAVFASYLIRIKPVPGLYIPYIATYLESPCYWRQLTDATSGTGQPNVNGQSLSNLLVPIPPFDEQMRIVVERNNIYPHLQKYTTAQDRLDALNESLREILKKSVLQEAIHGRLVPQDPREEPASVLLEQIREEKRKLLKEGKLKKKDLVDSIIIKGEDNKYYENRDGNVLDISGEIPFDVPDTWRWIRIGDYVKLVTDFVASGSFASLRENVRYYKTENYAILVKTQDFQHSFQKNLTFTDKHGYEFLSGSNLYGGELILSNVGSIGKVFIVPDLKRPMTLAPNAIMVKAFDDTHIPWLYYLLSSSFGYNAMMSISSATAMRKFNKTDFKKIPIPIPPIEEQRRIVKQIQTLQELL